MILFMLILSVAANLYLTDKFIGLESIFKNLFTRGTKDLTADRAELLLDYSDIIKNGITLDAESIIPFSENVVYRGITCGDCKKEGKCLNCQCKFSALQSTPKAYCSEKKFNKMILDPKEWEDFKSKNFEGKDFKLS